MGYTSLYRTAIRYRDTDTTYSLRKGLHMKIVAATPDTAKLRAISTGTMISTALEEAIEQVLRTHADGLNVREIRRAVVEETGRRCRPAEVREALDTYPDTFVSLAGGRWRLKAVIEAEDVAAGQAEPEREPREVVRPFLTDLPSLNQFIVFDLETTGLKPERDRIIQISAVRIIDGAPAPTGSHPAVFDEYVTLRVGDRELPYSLKVKLGFDRHPEWEAELEQAEPESRVFERFREWVGDLPLLAHNANFDYGFLKRAAGRIGWHVPTSRIVDSMELACLAVPHVDSFKLE